MRHLTRLAAAALAALLALPAAAATMSFTTVLTPEQEVTSAPTMHGGHGMPGGTGTGVTSDAFGAGTLTLTTRGDRFSLAYDLVFNDVLDFGFMRAGTPLDAIPADHPNAVSMLHVHAAPRGANGPVVYGLFNPSQDVAGQPVSVFTARDGTTRVSGAWDSGDGDPAFSRSLVGLLTAAMPGEDLPLYFNVHTIGVPAGEIRGQIVAASPAPIPVPAALPLLLGGIAAMGLVARRRRPA